MHKLPTFLSFFIITTQPLLLLAAAWARTCRGVDAPTVAVADVYGDYCGSGGRTARTFLLVGAANSF